MIIFAVDVVVVINVVIYIVIAIDAVITITMNGLKKKQSN